MTITMIGTVTAPVLMGLLYDITKSYSLAFYTLSVFIFLAGLCFLFIPKPVKKTTETVLNGA